VKNIINWYAVTATFFFLTIPNAQSAYVEKVKGKKALIYLEDLSVAKGDLVYTTDPSTGKKTSILRITTVKDQKAIGVLVKGKVKNSQEVIAKNGGRSAKQSAQLGNSGYQATKNSAFALGGFLGVNFDKMDFIIGSDTYKGSGTAFGVTGALDYKINDFLGLRGMIGMDQFKVDASPSFTTKITYITSMLWGRVNFLQKETKAWVGLGFGIWFPTGKSSNALDVSTIATTAAYALGGGVDLGFSDTLYIPVQLEYGFLPKSDLVKTSYYSIRAGVMLKY